MQSTKINKVVLAYSGGLDTSTIIPWLKENYGCEVICFTADVGQGQELDGLEARAIKSGASKLIIGDLREELVEEYILPMLHSGAIYEQRYLLGTSIARPVVAKHLVQVAEQEGADAIAHGCTGKGNDQVRFELAVMALNPKLKVIAPWREWDIQSREDALEYMAKHNIEFSVTKNPSLYSRDQNLWHISHEGGPLEDLDNAAQDDIYQLSVTLEQAPDQPESVAITFEQGNPVALNGEPMSALEIIEQLNLLGGKHAIGQIDLVENRLVGMKSRGIYETPGGTILYAAHRELESITLDRQTAHVKEMIALHYAELLYYGQWFSPLRVALDAFFSSTQHNVSGTITFKLYKGNLMVVKRESATSLYRQDIATFGHSAVYDQADAAGFIRLFGLPSMIHAQVNAQKPKAASFAQPEVPWEEQLPKYIPMPVHGED
jgi:argininosuccinate synthase